MIGDKYHVGFGGYSDDTDDNRYRDTYKRNGFNYGFLSLGWSSGASTIYNPYAFLSLLEKYALCKDTGNYQYSNML